MCIVFVIIYIGFVSIKSSVDNPIEIKIDTNMIPSYQLWDYHWIFCQSFIILINAECNMSAITVLYGIGTGGLSWNLL